MQSCTAHSPPQARPTRSGAYGGRCRCAAVQPRSLPHRAPARSDRRSRSALICRAEQQDPQHGEQQQEPSLGGPKFLFDEDPAPPSGEGGLGGNPQFAAVFKAALSRQSMSGDSPPPPPPPPPQQQQPAERAAEQAAEPPAEQPVDFGGPKFLFDDLPDPPAAGNGAAGPDLLSANPAFANVFKASLARQRSMMDSSGTDSSADSSSDKGVAATGQPTPPPAVPEAPQQQPRDHPNAPPRPAPVDPERRISAAEEVLHSALRDSRRNILGLQRMQKDLEDAMKREEQQFDRIHFALQKARSDAARMGVLQSMLDSRR